MAETTLTSAGIDWIAGVILEKIPAVTASATVLAVGDGTPSGSGLGSEHTGNGFARASGSATYASGTVTISYTFTASGADVTVSEAALYTTDSSPVLIGYVHFGEFDIASNGVINDGNSITIYFDVTITPGGTITSAITGGGGSATNITYTGASIAITLEGGASLDPASFPCVRGGLCFNGVRIRNGNISSITGVRGGRTWEITGYTEDFTDIERLEAYAAPVSISKTITGEQFISSVILPGVFKIWSVAGQTHTIEDNCWISDQVQIEPFGVGWWFGFSIVQGV